MFEKKNEPIPTGGITGEEILKRSTLNKSDLIGIDSYFGEEKDAFILSQIETEIKYDGYLKKQEQAIREMRKMEKHILGNDFDYDKVDGLRLEAKEKLKEVRPYTLAQASRISGVNPADIVVLMIHIENKKTNS